MSLALSGNCPLRIMFARSCWDAGELAGNVTAIGRYRFRNSFTQFACAKALDAVLKLWISLGLFVPQSFDGI